MRRAFTLIEMLVALSVLAVAIVIVTSVFALTARTARQAVAITEIETQFRSFFAQLEADLAGCDPASSILVIAGRNQAAALTEDLRVGGRYWRVALDPNAPDFASFDPLFGGPADPSAGGNGYSDPRADVLMFFTQRALGSAAPARTTDPPDDFEKMLQAGGQISPAQVVYGHGALTTVSIPAGGGAPVWSNTVMHIETSDPDGQLSPLPLTRWILARRVVLVNDTVPGSADGNLAAPPTRIGFGNDPRNTWERVLRNYSDDANYSAESVQFDYSGLLAFFEPYEVVLGTTRLIRGRALLDPYATTIVPDFTSNELMAVWNVLYRDGDEQNRHVATLVEQPPADVQSNKSMQMLPGCAWFQVEFLLPEDPRNDTNHPLAMQRADMPRWVEVPHGQTYVFVPDSQENRELVASEVNPDGTAIGGSRLEMFAQRVPGPPGPDYGGRDLVTNRVVRLWPWAIRVTVRVIDRDGNLDEPLVRTFVHRFR